MEYSLKNVTKMVVEDKKEIRICNLVLFIENADYPKYLFFFIHSTLLLL